MKSTNTKTYPYCFGPGAIMLLALILTGCPADPGTEETVLVSQEEIIARVLAEKPVYLDPGLYLYRNPLTQQVITDFYTSISGNREITRPILRYSDNYDIPLPLAFALVWAESSFKPWAINRNSQSVDRGLFQLNSNSFPYLAVEDFYNPETNAKHGLAHLRFCLNEGKSEIIALAMYNAGTHRVKKGTPYSTLKYIARIMEYKGQLETSFQELIDNSLRVARLITPGEDS